MGGCVGGDRIKVSLLWSLLWRLLYKSFLLNNNFWLLQHGLLIYKINQQIKNQPVLPLYAIKTTKFNNSNKADVSYGDSFCNVLKDPNSQVLILDVIRGTLFKCVQYKHTFPHKTSKLLMKQWYLWTATALVYSFIQVYLCSLFNPSQVTVVFLPLLSPLQRTE